jgi:hypothetical protein
MNVVFIGAAKEIHAISSNLTRYIKFVLFYGSNTDPLITKFGHYEYLIATVVTTVRA